MAKKKQPSVMEAPSQHTPAAVLEAEAEAQATIARLTNQTTEPGSSAAEPAVSAESTIGSPTAETETTAKRTVEPGSESAPETVSGDQDPLSKLQRENDDLLSKMRARDGKHGSDLESLRQQLDRQGQLMATLMEEKATANSTNGAESPASSVAPAADLDAAARKYITPEQITEYGEDGVAFFTAIFRGLFEASIPSQMDAVHTRIDQVDSSTSRDWFWMQVEQLSSGAIGINDDAAYNGFDEFLALPAKYGKTTGQMAEDAKAEGNYTAVAEVFDDFKKSRGMDTAAPAKPGADGAGDAAAGSQEHVVPALGASVEADVGASGRDPSKVVYTNAQYQDYYEGVRTGRIKPTPGEHQAQELQFAKAMSEGRFKYDA